MNDTAIINRKTNIKQETGQSCTLNQCYLLLLLVSEWPQALRTCKSTQDVYLQLKALPIKTDKRLVKIIRICFGLLLHKN